MSIYKSDREAAARFADTRAAKIHDDLQSWNLRQRTASDQKDFGGAYSALITAINHAKQASPDFLHQVPTDEAAAMILSRWPPSSGVSF